MIMTSMRQKTKIVLFAVLLAFVGFIFFDWGMNVGTRGAPRSGAVGKVNGQDITDDAYRRMRQQMIDTFEQRTGRQPEFADFDAIEDETWLSLVRETLVQQQIEKYGVAISDPEILELLRTNPPDVIRSQFTNEKGEFDVAAYQTALSNPALAAQWAAVEDYLRAMLPADKLQNYVGLNARVTSAEVRERFLARNEKVKARYVASLAAALPERELPEDALSEDKLRAWYDAHLTDYAVGEQAVLEAARISKAPSSSDSVQVRQDLEDLRRQILEGADFAEIARAWSDDPGSAERGGDLGFFGRGSMVPEFEQVAFATPVGQVSEVFSSPFGYHVLKVEERKTEGGQETVHARHILLKIEPSNETLREASNRMDDFLAAVNEDKRDFSEAAREAGLTVETTPPFERGGPIPGIGLVRAAERFAFSASPGTVTSDPIESETDLWALRIVERRPPGTAPFEDVKERVEASVAESTRRESARRRMEEALASSDGTVDGVARALGAPVDTTAEFSQDGFVPGIGRRNAFVAAAFALPAEATSGLVESDRGFYVIQVLERVPADESQFAAQVDELRRQMLMEKRQALITGWVEELMANAKIVDYRSGKAEEWKPDPDMFAYAKVGA